MPTIEEKIVLSREARDKADEKFREALRNGHASGMSWDEIATVAGMSRFGVRYLAKNLNGQRSAAKGERTK